MRALWRSKSSGRSTPAPILARLIGCARCLIRPMRTCARLQQSATPCAQLADQDTLLRELDDAWNSHDGKDRFGKLMQKVEALSASAEPASKSGWVDWHGGECPVLDDAEVEYSLLGNPGKVFSAVAARLDWQHDHRPSRKKPNICRYRSKQASASAEPQVES